jgi:hypothetical protein
LPVGTYEMVVAAEEPRPGCVNGRIHIELRVGDESITRYRILGDQRGTGQEFGYSRFRDLITLRAPNRTLSGRWSFDGSKLTISDLDSDRCADESDWTAAPFELVG